MNQSNDSGLNLDHLEALAPCPFCGEESSVKDEDIQRQIQAPVHFQCDVCKAAGPAGNNVREALAAWSRRAGMQEPEGAMCLTLQHDAANKSGIARGTILQYPDSPQRLMVVGEDNTHLHTFILGAGTYYGIFKAKANLESVKVASPTVERPPLLPREIFSSKSDYALYRAELMLWEDWASRSGLANQPAPTVPEGWPTTQMINAGFKAGLSGKIGSGFRAMLAAAPVALAHQPAQEQAEPLRPLSHGLPSPDDYPRVLVYTDGVDFAGEQYFDIKTEDLWELEQPTEVAEAATHWMPHPGAQAAQQEPVAALQQVAAPGHETIVREGGNLVCTACGTSAPGTPEAPKGGA